MESCRQNGRGDKVRDCCSSYIGKEEDACRESQGTSGGSCVDMQQKNTKKDRDLWLEALCTRRTREEVRVQWLVL